MKTSRQNRYIQYKHAHIFNQYNPHYKQVGRYFMQEYDPFAYPPNFQIARIHQQATKPGKIDLKKAMVCPCCQLKTRQPLKSWFYRSIDQDFKNYGGAVVTYFWLVKLYAFICMIVLIIYSSYLIACIHRMCSLVPSKEYQCQSFLGIKIISNQRLFALMKILDKKQEMTRIMTLRTMTFVILLIGNLMALYTSGRFKRRYPQPKGINDFSLIFKNVHKSIEYFTLDLKTNFPTLQIRQIFNVKSMQPFYTLYNRKLETYYQSLIQKKQQKHSKLVNKLELLDRKCSKQSHNYQVQSDRVIVVFQSQLQRNQILEKYQLKGSEKVKYVLGLNVENKVYAQACPIPDQIIWNNLGSLDDQKIKLKVLSVIYFFLLIGGSYLVLFFCMKLAYNRDILPDPWSTIIANIIMTLMVPVALTFRQLMNKLSQMRRPNTLTNRTMFIVLTTVLFHFIYYIIIPTFYLRFSDRVDQNNILAIITNQTFNFLVVQFILAKIDFIFCQWNKRLKKVQDQANPIGCQKILHNHMQYPRFPIQFKLIILFKTFSFIILFAFQSPFIMFLCFALMLFLYFSDKFAVYTHYRMEIINNGVQFKFLKVYSVFFSIYTFLIYSLTQHFQDLSIQFYSALALMVIAIIVQIFFIKDRIFEDETILPSTLQELQIKDSYRQRFDKFREFVVNDRVDMEIKQYLTKYGYGSLQTQETLSTREKLVAS